MCGEEPQLLVSLLTKCLCFRWPETTRQWRLRNPATALKMPSTKMCLVWFPGQVILLRFSTLLAAASTRLILCQIHTQQYSLSLYNSHSSWKRSKTTQIFTIFSECSLLSRATEDIWNAARPIHAYKYANIYNISIYFLSCSAASPHSSTPNISAVHHADSRGSLISTDSGNSLLDKSSDKTNSLEKVRWQGTVQMVKDTQCTFTSFPSLFFIILNSRFTHTYLDVLAM